MNFAFGRGHEAIRAKARGIADEVLRPRALERDQTDAFPLEEARVLAQAGLMGVQIPSEYGGLGLGLMDYALAIHEIAGACASTAVTMAVTNMTGEMIHRFGTPEQHARLLPRLTGGERPVGSFCLSEPHSGSDAAALKARAVRDGDEWVLNGSKMWVTSGAHCSVALVMARTGEQKSRGITTFLIERGNPGYVPSEAEEKMGLRGSNTSEISLEDCRVPHANLLGEEGQGFEVAMTALDGGRVGIGAQALGIARSALQVAARAVAGKGRAAGQAEHFRIADAAADLDAGWLMVMRAAFLRGAGRRMTRQAAMAKVFATEAAGRVVERCVEALGVGGLVPSNDVERYLRDVRVTRIYEGTSEIQRLVIARELLKGM